MVADHWFMQIENILEAMEITSDATRIRLAAFQLEDEAHRQGHQGSRGVSTPSHSRLSQQISRLYRVRFCYLAYGLECYLILVLRIRSLLHQL